MDLKVTNVLNNLLTIADSSNDFWNVPPTTGNFLNMLVRLTHAEKILEIGTSNGLSGIYLSEALSHTGGKLYTIESHKKRFAMAQENFEKSGLSPFIEQIFGHAPEILADIDHEFDIIFIDATKMEYKSYVEVLLPKLKKGGLMICDNAVSHQKDMQNFVDFIHTREELQNLLLPIDKGLMVSYKIL